MTTACAALVAAAVVLDACGARIAPADVPWRWADLAALACLAWGFRPGAAGDAAAHDEGGPAAAPVGGLMLGALAVATVRAACGGAGGALATALAAFAAYHGLARAFRRRPGAVASVWPAFALFAGGAGALVLAVALGARSLAPLARACAEADARLGGAHEAVRLLAALALVTCGRALEPGARAWWRVAAALALAGTLTLADAAGAGLGAAALARLDDPAVFASASLALLLVAAIGRTAWRVARERPEERVRWRALALVCAACGLGVLLGDAGGEGVGMFAAVVAALATGSQGARARDAAEDAPPMAGASQDGDPPAGQPLAA